MCVLLPIAAHSWLPQGIILVNSNKCFFCSDIGALGGGSIRRGEHWEGGSTPPNAPTLPILPLSCSHPPNFPIIPMFPPLNAPTLPILPPSKVGTLGGWKLWEGEHQFPRYTRMINALPSHGRWPLTDCNVQTWATHTYKLVHATQSLLRVLVKYQWGECKAMREISLVPRPPPSFVACSSFVCIGNEISISHSLFWKVRLPNQ